MAVAVRSVTVKPMRDRRRKRVEAKVFDETGPMVAVWWNQPWIARQLGEGSQVLLHGTLKQRNQFHVKEHEPFGGGGGARCTPSAWCPCIPPPRAVGRDAAQADLGRVRARSATWSSRCPRRCAVAERLPDRPGGAGRRALPRHRGRRGRRAPPAGLRGAATCPSWRWPAAAGPAAAARAARAGAGRRRRWSTRGWRRCRSS